jgi:outer membrane protein assembly factor BamA
MDGRAVSVEQAARFRETDRRLTGLVAYPFHRSARLELGLGYRHASFSNEVQTRAFSLDDGSRLSDTTSTLAAPRPLHLVEAAVAFVHDSSLFGPTSPIRGQRHRLELTPTLGSHPFTSVLADLRRYAMPVRPLTLAARVTHYGRYGRNAEHARMAPLFVGYPQLVRGYDVGAFGRGRCRPGGCPRIEQLVGSRLLVASVEARVPALFAFNRSRPYGPLPIEAALFFDAGVAWTSGEAPGFLGGSRPGVSSWGATLRFNLFGMAIGELNYVRPLDLPGKSSLWRFNLTPGF